MKIFSVCLLILFGASQQVLAEMSGHHDQHHDQKGSNGGKMLLDGEISVELAIFERGVPPEYRAWIQHNGKPTEGILSVELTRLGGKVDNFQFKAKNDYWLGSGVVEEPHSFDVKVTLKSAGKEFLWEFESHEGRVRIDAEIASAAGVTTATAGAGEVHKTMTLYGKTVTDPSKISHLRARFPGIITQVKANIGSFVKAGQVLAQIESNQSLKRYSIKAPFSGVITARHANPGELAEQQVLFTVTNDDQLWAELRVFPRQAAQISAAQSVTLTADNRLAESSIKHLLSDTTGKPFMIARVPLDNRKKQWSPGLMIEAQVSVEKTQVPLVVDNRGLQSFRDWSVVFIQVGDQYEIRPLTLGHSDGRFTEVLAGLNVGDRYVVENSYLIKADIEKSGASHDH